MTAKAIDYRESILSKISDLPDEKLALVDEYLRTITDKENSSAIILSYAGIFNDIDNEVLADLTVNLSENRIAQTSDFLKD
jgi:ssDNA-specific exonuclease RecJ